MGEVFISILVPLSFFGTIFGIVYVVTTSRHREKMAMIEKGYDARLFDPPKKEKKYNALKFGLLAIGVSAGLMLGFFVEDNFFIDDDVAYFSMALLGGGTSLLIYHKKMRAIAQKEYEREQYDFID